MTKLQKTAYIFTKTAFTRILPRFSKLFSFS